MVETNASSAAPIVVALNFERPSVFALRRAAEIFRRSPALSLELVNVLEGVPELGNGEQRAPETAERLRKFVRENLGDPGAVAGRQVGIHVRAGDVAEEIATFAREVEAQLVVVGSHGREGMLKKILGSTSERVLACSTVPVLLATGDPSREPPAIDPVCVNCRRERASTRGRSWWCARHAEHHPRAHTYSFREEWPAALHDSEVDASAVDHA
jgi:nucleotide-binding universal stress UspA family protein